MERARALVAVCLVASLTLPLQALGQSPVEDRATGQLVRFNATRFDDTLFAGLEPTHRVHLDERGDVWYATQAGIVFVDVEQGTRRLYTRMDGLPSSYTLGVVTTPQKVYAATDLGLGVMDRATGTWTGHRAGGSPLPDPIVREIALDGTTLWIGMHFGGVISLDTETGEWGAAKNTSTRPDHAKPVRRIVPTEDAVWVGTDGDGVWRLDRATGNWSVLLRPDGLAANTVLGIAEMGDDMWFGTSVGLQRRAADGTWTLYNRSNGMPDERVWDVDVIATQEGPLNVFAATRQGVWQLDPETEAYAVLAQSFGILGDFVVDMVRTSDSWAFATNRGVSLLRDVSGWRYFTTGPSAGPSNGPLSHSFTAIGTGDSEPFLWFGTDAGIAAFLPATADRAGAWYNFGEWSRYPGGRVNAIDVAGNTTWVASSAGVRSYDTDAGVWIEHTVEGSRNLVYGLDVAQGELWVPLFGDGLLMRNLTTGMERSWTYQSVPEPIPSTSLTDLRIQGDDVWLGSDVGVLRLHRVTGTFLGTYSVADGLPSYGAVFRVLPDGNVVWVGMKDGGVARLDVATGKVTRVWNATNVPGFPATEPANNVLSMHREGSRLWVGSKGGLMRIDVPSGQARVFNQSNSDLVQDFVYGISSQDGLLYLATASGVARMDIETGRFFPMQDGAGAQVVGTSPTGPRATPVTVRIDAPRDGTGVAGVIEIRGTAARFGGRVDAVEVRIGDGEWTRARGTEAWSLSWDTSTAPQNEPIAVSARAIAGNDTSRIVDILVTPVALPTIPLEIEHTPVENATALRPLLLGAKVTGDEDLSARLYYKVPGGDVFKRLDMQRQGALFTASIPAKEVREGTLQYYIEAYSNRLPRTSPEDLGAPHRVEVGPPPRLSAAVEGPARLAATAGKDTPFVLNVTNTGSEPGTFLLTSSGIRAHWLTVPDAPLALEPGASASVEATLRVPAQAFADNTTLQFEVRDATGAAEPSRATVPVEILASQAPPTPTTNAAPSKPAPAPGVALALAALGVALVLRRWRS